MMVWALSMMLKKPQNLGVKPQQLYVGGESVATELSKFADLRDKGFLTEEEFNEKKEELLGMTTMPDIQQAQPADFVIHIILVFIFSLTGFLFIWILFFW